MIERRRFLRLGLAGAAFAAGTAHTPYRRWQIYRKRHLLIGTSRADAPSYPLGKKIVATLAEWLPESSARVSRAPDQQRLASLITTGQIEVIVLSRADAAALSEGRAPFADFGPTPLAALFTYGEHLLVTRPDFPERHAWLVVKTLTEHSGEIDGAAPAEPGALPVPVHPGARAYAEGAPEPPPPPPDEDPDLAVGHTH
jgi:TRAP-type uncharacterized transport system substrate-binding protein